MTGSGGAVVLVRRGVHPSELDDVGRDEAIVVVRDALRRRSGRSWSVTGGRGTAWGWIRIAAPPSCRDTLGGMSDADRRELSLLLGVDVHYQGVDVPASSEYRRLFMARALGLETNTAPVRYWD